MQNKILYTILAVLVVALIGLYIYGKNQAQAPTVETHNENQNTASLLTAPENINSNPSANNASTQANAETENNQNSNSNSQGQYSDESDIQGNDAAVQEIIYDGSKFSPSSMTVKKGDIVIFKNNSDGGFWPASGPHPSHTNYPEFDAKSSVGAGKTFQFKFNKVGNWPFHDHLNPSATGSIKVTE